LITVIIDLILIIIITKLHTKKKQKKHHSSKTYTVAPLRPLFARFASVRWTDGPWWRFGAVDNDVGQIIEVALRRARLVLGWVTYRGSTPGAEIYLSLSNHAGQFSLAIPSWVGNKYRPKGGDALRLGVKADMVLFAGNTV